VKARGWEVLQRIRQGETLVFDGGYGTMLFAAGLANGACPELWNDTHADVVRSIHQGYFDAGSDIVETNTFGGSRLKLNEYQLGDRTRELNIEGARLARSGRPPHGYVAGSIGPTSRLPAEYEPLGDTTDEEYFQTFREQAAALAEGGVDLFAVETMMFPQEAAAAIRACKAVADLPVMATMFFQFEELHDRDRTMWGESPAEVAKNLLAAGADVVGMNCGRGPDRAVVIIGQMRAVTDAPLAAYPNAGLPITTGDTVTYELGPEEMARHYPALLEAGCNIVGACCGSNPEHIRRIATVVRAAGRRRAGPRPPEASEAGECRPPEARL
jgi:5-methyltetrahydrofolate--homocysteine methyltransferase